MVAVLVLVFVVMVVVVGEDVVVIGVMSKISPAGPKTLQKRAAKGLKIGGHGVI